MRVILFIAITLLSTLASAQFKYGLSGESNLCKWRQTRYAGIVSLSDTSIFENKFPLGFGSSLSLKYQFKKPRGFYVSSGVGMKITSVNQTWVAYGGERRKTEQHDYYIKIPLSLGFQHNDFSIEGGINYYHLIGYTAKFNMPVYDNKGHRHYESFFISNKTVHNNFSHAPQYLNPKNLTSAFVELACYFELSDKILISLFINGEIETYPINYYKRIDYGLAGHVYSKYYMLNFGLRLLRK